MPDPTFELYRLDRELTRDELITQLGEVPARLREVLSGRSADELTRTVGDGWSAIEVCRHVRDAVQVYGVRFKWMILNDEPFLPNYDENRWVTESPDGVDQLDAVLGEIAAYRAETARLLRSLSVEGWARRGRHEVIGLVALEPYVRHELAHEEQHLAQLTAAFG